MEYTSAYYKFNGPALPAKKISISRPSVIDKLKLKGFNGSDIHNFLSRFQIGVATTMPEFEFQKKAWKEAEIAVDFELPK